MTKSEPLLLKHTEYEIEHRLAERYCPPEWAFLPQVGSGTGTHYRRTADGIAMNLWPSRGMELHGFEIKVARNDWIRELKDPEKSVAVQKYCNRWWIVAPKGVVADGELPPTWGLLEPTGKSGLKVVTAAPELEDPKRLSRTFVAAVLRQATKVTTPQAKLDDEYMRGKREGTEAAELRIKYANDQADELQRKIDEFQEKSGVSINCWDVGRIGDAVRQVLRGVDVVGALKVERKHLGMLIERVDKTIENLENENALL